MFKFTNPLNAFKGYHKFNINFCLETVPLLNLIVGQILNKMPDGIKIEKAMKINF